jgi:Janus/Ocnus family (Ocnus)
VILIVSVKMPGTLASRTATKMDLVDDVLIDVGGRFKYILCKVYEPSETSNAGSFKYIVRGTSLAEFHCMALCSFPF